MQNQLSTLQFDKERWENEAARMRSGGLQSNNLIQKRNELEMDLDIANKNIHNIKQKLKEMGALWEKFMVSLNIIDLFIKY